MHFRPSSLNLGVYTTNRVEAFFLLLKMIIKENKIFFLMNFKTFLKGKILKQMTKLKKKGDNTDTKRNERHVFLPSKILFN